MSRSEDYTKEESRMIAGIAIIMMFSFHILGTGIVIKDWDSLISYSYNGTPLAYILGGFGQLCIGIFAFNSGYVICKYPESYRNFRLVFPRLMRFLCAYWIVCVLFLIYGAAASCPLPDGKTLLQNFFGFKLNYLNYISVHYGWYVSFYIILLLLSPLLVWLLKRTGKIADLAIYIAAFIAIQFCNERIGVPFWPITAALTGYMVCKYHILGSIRHFFSDKKAPLVCCVSIAIILGLIALRTKFTPGTPLNSWGRLEGIIAFLFIASILVVSSRIPTKIRNGLIFLGTYSLYLWFLHSIIGFLPEEAKKIITAPKVPILIVAWTLLLFMLPAIVLRRFHVRLTQSRLFPSLR